MHIAFVMYNFKDRADTSICFELAREMVKRGHRVTLIAKSETRRFRFETCLRGGVRLLLTPRGIPGRWHSKSCAPYDVLSRIYHLAKGKYDVFVGYDCRVDVYVPFRYMRGRIPLRIAVWGDRWGGGGLAASADAFAFQRRLEAKWERTMMLEADGVVSTSQTLLGLGKEWGISDSRLCYIPHGSPVDLIQVLPKDPARHKIGMDGKGPIICYLGHGGVKLQPWLASFQRLIKRYPQAIFLCIGSCKEDLLKRVEQTGLTSHFHFTGFVPNTEISSWLASSDLFLISLSPNSVNDHYRYPGKLGHYLAAGRPIVAPDVGEPARIIKEERVGLVVQPDLRDAEERICELIENKALAKDLGMKARKVAEQHFAWSILADRFEQFIQILNNDHS